MAQERERYRKLPGHRRGFLRGASLWLGSDHLLSVKSLRFREEYKRFHLRDVQAIVVANASRFHLSTRAASIGCLWLIALLAARNREPWILVVLWSAGVLLVGGWLYVSAARSCRCRIYTAVSRDDLPSIYRTWTARKFLAGLEPRIAEVQGVIEGNWAEAIGQRDVGPPATTVVATSFRQDDVPGAGPDIQEPPREIRPAGRSRTTASDIFVVSIFADALLNIGTLHSMTRTIQWLWYGLAFVQIAGAVFIFLQHHRGILKAGMQKLAITTLIVMGAAYYLRQVIAGVSSAGRPMLPDPLALAKMPSYILLREVDAGICLALGVMGVVLALMENDNIEQPRSIAG